MLCSDSKIISVGEKKLVHYALCPLSRFIRLILSEKKQNYSLIEEPFWEERDNFIALNPSGQVPILIEADKKTVICDVYPVFEYLEDTLGHDNMGLMPADIEGRAEVRRLISWFNVKFYNNISGALVRERVIKRLTRNGYPDSSIIRKALQMVPENIAYMSYLLENRDWLAGNIMTAADLCAAAHISVIDYLGNITWTLQHYKRELQIVREWYAKMKSRKSFRDLTHDVVKGFSPPDYYANPDF